MKALASVLLDYTATSTNSRLKVVLVLFTTSRVRYLDC